MLNFIKNLFSNKDDLELGEDAIESGNYSLAIKKLLPLADNGNSRAQNDIGLLYLEGKGKFKQDSAMAFKYFKLSAEQGFKIGQSNLGIRYMIGDGVEKNEIMEKGKYLPMKDDTRDLLLDFYKIHNEKLFKLINKKFDWEN